MRRYILRTLALLIIIGARLTDYMVMGNDWHNTIWFFAGCTVVLLINQLNKH